MKINVIDGIMGVGKTTMAIDMIKQDTENNYIYITPYLNECKRIKEECKDKKFTEPSVEKSGSKKRDLKKLINYNRNIVSTHSLFKGIDSETRELLSVKDYILVLDEVMDVVEPVEITKDDLAVILKEYVEIQENREMKWINDEYEGKFQEYKDLCEENSLLLIDSTVVMWKFPVEVFKHFKEVYILTYLFDSQIQKYYFDYYDLKYDYKSIDRVDGKYKLVEKGESKFENEKIKQISTLLEVCGGKYNNIGKDKYSLSVAWFAKNKNKILVKELKRNVFNFFKNKCATKTDENGWTTFVKYKSSVSGKGYTKGFISLNMRATNEFQDKKSMAYAANRFMNPYLKKMFSFKGIKINEDGWALSEMLQWIWRGCIRQNQPMKLYIPSKRMRDLFKEWMKNEG